MRAYTSSDVMFFVISISTASSSGRAVSMCSSTMAIMPLSASSLKDDLSSEHDASTRRPEAHSGSLSWWLRTRSVISGTPRSAMNVLQPSSVRTISASTGNAATRNASSPIYFFTALIRIEM